MIQGGLLLQTQTICQSSNFEAEHFCGTTYSISQRLDTPRHHCCIEAWNIAFYTCLLGCVGKNSFINQATNNKDIDAFELSCEMVLGVIKAE